MKKNIAKLNQKLKTKKGHFIDITGLNCFKCPNCSKEIPVHPRTEESMQHMKETEDIQKWQRENLLKNMFCIQNILLLESLLRMKG